jgi:hypothetical protein
MSKVMSHLRYASYMARHKWFVYKAGRKVKAPLWRLIIHDWTKFTPAEWGPYARRFFDAKNSNPEEFDRAWTHHWHNNPHHWQHWVTSSHIPMPMPDHFIREMVADWMGTGRVNSGEWEVDQWYSKNRDTIKLHPATRERVENYIMLVNTIQTC